MTDALLAELGDLAEHRLEGRTLRERIETDLTPSRRDALDRLAMVVLRRGVAEAGHARAAVDELEQLGCRVVAARLVRMTPAIFDHLYRIRAVLFGDNWWVHHRIVDGHPVAVLLLTGDPGDHESLSLRLNAVKGASSPAAGSAGLRTRLGRPTSFHPVVHFAATSASVLYEAVVYEWRELLAALDGEATGASADLVLPCLDLANERFATVHGLARRVAWCCAGLAMVHASSLEAPAERIRAALEGIESGGSFTEARADHLRSAVAVRDDVADLVVRSHAATVDAIAALSPSAGVWAVRNAIAPRQLAQAVQFLLGLAECDGWHVEALIDGLVDHGIALREDHRHWLLAGLRSDLNPHASFGGVRLYPLADP